MAPKMKQPPQDTSGPGGETVNQSSSKSKTKKSQVSQSQDQRSADVTKKRKNRSDTSSAGNPNQAIDLTGDDSDTPTASKKTATTKQLQQATKKENDSGSTQRSTYRPLAPAFSSPSSNSGKNVNSTSLMSASGQQALPSGRLAKRARVEDVTDTDGVSIMPTVQQFNMAPPRSPATNLINTPAANLLRPQPNLASNGVPSRNPGTGECCYELEANPLRTIRPNPTMISGILSNFTDSPRSRFEPYMTLGPTPPRSRTESASTPSFAQKIKLSREIGIALGISERDAYQLLMRCGWVGDNAVLAHLSAGGAREVEEEEDVGAGVGAVGGDEKGTRA